ncbi:MAG: hypothetical protein ACTSX0_00220 [Promethearchaeota archaeon]
MNIGVLARFFVYLVFGLLFFSIVKISVTIFSYYTQHKQDENETREKLETRQEPLNLIGMLLLLLFIFILINIKVGFEFDGTAGDLPGKIMAIIPAVFGLLILMNSAFQLIRGKKKVRRYGLKNEQEEILLSQQIKLDLKRKFYHLLIFVLIFCFLLTFFIIIKSRSINGDFADFYQKLLESFWGFSDEISFVNLIFLRQSLPLAQTLTILFMYGAMIVLLFNDLSRLSHNLQFIFHKESQKIMRYKELDTLASYTHFAIAYLTASLILPPMLFLASLCLGSFADPIASFIGMKFGKIKYKWNSKSLEGTIAGVIMAFVSMIWFVGPIYAAIGAFCFALTDLFTPKPIELSDNLLMPIVITIFFIILAICGISPIHYL